MKKKNYYIISGIFVIALISILIILMVRRNTILEKNSTYFQNKDTILAADDLISKQAEVDSQVLKYQKDHNNTFDNPKVLQNPYFISPLSALIIFETDNEVSVDVSVNGIFMTTYEKSKTHSIEIYGLRTNFANQVELKTSEGKIKTITLQTEKHLGQTFHMEVKNALHKDHYYFLSAPMGLGISAVDGEGNLVWYLTEGYNQDIEFLENGHFLVSNGESTGGEFGFTGFVEVDYLGKIYHNYVLENAYHHEVNELENGNLMIAGASNKGDASENFVYTIDRNSGKVLDYLNIYDLLVQIDGEIASKLTGKDFINNSIDYHEDTDEMILSLRGLNSIISVQYKEKKLNWILGNSNFWTGKFKEYLLSFTDNSRLPLGQHTAFLTEEGNLAIFNNDFDATKVDVDTPLSNYVNSYSSATIYEMKGKNISTIYEYISPERGFNYALGSFNYTKEGNKLINFGWNFKQEAFDKNLNLFDYFGYTYARIIELDDKNNVIFNGTIEQSIYRAFKNSFYKESEANYQVENYSLIDNTPYNSLEKVRTSSLYEELNSAIPSIYEYNVTKNSVDIDAIFDDLLDVSFLFVGKDENSYIFHYKPVNESAPVTIHLNLNGEYAVYLKVGDTIYDSGKIFQF